MDYLEGLFLGKLWSDTDFENRRHGSLFIIYGLFVDVLVLYYYMMGQPLFHLGEFDMVQLIVFGVLFIACPFICMRYYRMPFWGKALVMIEKVIKSLIVVSFTVSLMEPRLTVKFDELQDFIIAYLNSTLETYTEKFAASTGSFATVIGVLAGGVHVLLVILIGIVVAIAFPGLLYLAYRVVQYCYDWVLNQLIIKRFFPNRR